MISKSNSIVRSFRDLTVWQRSMDLAELVYRLTRDFLREETYDLTVQLKRCAVSFPSNIAEGQGRLNTREFKQFLGIARGSNCELQTQLELARRLGLGDVRLTVKPRDSRMRSARGFSRFWESCGPEQASD
jgi:four helix bundle protein